MDFSKAIESLSKLNFKNMYEGDFFLTWDKTDDEIKAVWEVADALRALRERNISTKVCCCLLNCLPMSFCSQCLLLV